DQPQDPAAIDPLDEFLSGELEQLGFAPGHTRAARLRGDAPNSDDIRLERLVEERGGVPKRGRMKFWKDAAAAWVAKEWGHITAEALRKRWERIQTSK